jgi:LuxR family maltose regulon positive regulatory protein
MSIPILSTKLNIPPVRPGLVPRPRLSERLEEAASKRLILVSAPAGFGKTTTLSTWAQESGFPTAWLSLDDEDNDPTRFLVYTTTALKTIEAQVGETTLALLSSTQSFSYQAALTTLINELSVIPHDFALCLDDYHLIEAQEIHAALAYLIEHLPAKMHLALASRSDPPLPLSRLRVRAQLMELREADLRFTPAEAAEFLNRSTGLELTAEQIAALEARTEGWIAGLQLAALSMRGREELGAFIQAFSGSHRFVIDYLADEVFSQQPEEMCLFLRQTAILDRFTASLCDAVTRLEDSAARLRALEDANLFLTPLDDQRQWYRYHHLFQDFLRAGLDERSKADLNKKASQWFVSQGLLVEAVKHALASGDQELAERVITPAAMEALKRGDMQTLLGWIDTLPDRNVRANAELSICKSFALFLTSSYDAALPYALAAEKSLQANASSSLQGQLLSLKAQLALCEDRLDDSIHYSRDAVEYLDDEDQFFRNLTLNALGQVLEMKGDVASAAEVYHQAFESGWRSGDRLSALLVLTNLVFALNELGRRREADAWCQRVIDDVKDLGASSTPLFDAVYLSWSLLEYEANQLDTAREYTQRALEILTAANVAQGITWGHYILARIHLAEGDFKQARQIARQGRQLASQIGRDYPHRLWFAALKAQIDLESGDPATALRWAERVGFTPQESPHHWVEHPYFTYTRALLAQGHYEQARTLLNTMEARAREEDRDRKLITIHLLHALRLSAQGERQAAIERVVRALELAAPQDYRRAFLDEGQGIAELLPAARHAAHTFVDELLLAAHSPEVPAPQMERLVNPLTERELEVLRLVAVGLSNREIAERLVITIGTVKKHLNNIFSKLYVTSRTQAAAKGRELGILK